MLSFLGWGLRLLGWLFVFWLGFRLFAMLFVVGSCRLCTSVRLDCCRLGWFSLVISCLL